MEGLAAKRVIHMSARDYIHALVRRVLEKDGWTITHDPYSLIFGGTTVFVDLGAESPMGAEKDGRKIAVEAKGFLGKSFITDLQRALGQFLLYSSLLEDEEPERVLFLALPQDAFDRVFLNPQAQKLITRANLKLFLFDAQAEEITKWIM